MICDQLFIDLSTRADGEADAAALTRLDRHVPFCEQCQDRARALGDIRGEIERMAGAPPPQDFAERTARGVRHRMQRRSPWERVSPLFASLARGDAWTRVAASVATALLVLGSVASGAVTMLHFLTGPYSDTPFTPDVAASVAAWKSILAYPPVDWRLLTALILACGAIALGLPALVHDVARRLRVPISSGVAVFAGLYALGAMALVPFLSSVVLGEWFIEGFPARSSQLLDALSLVLAAWSSLLVVTAFACLVSRTVRGVPAAALLFTGCWAAAYATEWLVGWLRTPQAMLTSAFRELVTVPVLVPLPQLVSETLLAALVLGVAGALALGGCLSYRTTDRRPLTALAAMLVVAWLAHVSIIVGALQPPPRPTPPAAATTERTVALLISDPRRNLKTHNRSTTNPDGSQTVRSRGSKDLPLVDSPLPGELVAMAEAVEAYRTAPFTRDTPWAYGILTDVAAMQWDQARILALSEEIITRTPGVSHHGRYLRWRLPSLPVFTPAMREYLARMSQRCSATTYTRPLPSPRGGLRGRLFIDGRPAASVWVRILTDQNITSAWDIDAAGRRQVADNTLGDLRYEARAPMRKLTGEMADSQQPFPAGFPTATRTATDGTFRFDHLAPRGYFLAVMLPGRVTSVRAEGTVTAPSQADADARVDRVVDITWVRDSVVDVGDIRLRVQR